MIGLIQRAKTAFVEISGEKVAEIDLGMLVLACVERDDSSKNAVRLAERLASYRVFSDENGKMNLNVGDIGGQILLVPQFTLAADTRKGTRAGFSRSAPPELGRALFATLVDEVASHGVLGGQGQFGADMQVYLVNDGPVTFWLTA